MKKLMLGLAVACLIVTISAGVATALTFTCTTNPCNGTNNADQIHGRKAVDDTIYGKDGGDLIWDISCTPDEGGAACRDHDTIFAGAGNDEFDVADGNYPDDVDTVDCGKGSNDHANVDPNDIVSANCEVVSVWDTV